MSELTPRERAELALTVLLHETGSATISLSGLTLSDIRVDLGQRVADAIADAEEATTREWVKRTAALQAENATLRAQVEAHEEAWYELWNNCGEQDAKPSDPWTLMRRINAAMLDSEALIEAQVETLTQENAALAWEVSKSAEAAMKAEAARAAAEARMKQFVESEQFYDLMQAYRHAPLAPQREVIAAFEAIQEALVSPPQEPR